GIVEDLTACHDVLAGMGIESRPWFRAPQGELGQAQVDAAAAVNLAGYRHVHWHTHGEDWRPGATPEEVASTILAGVQDRWPRPAIVLLHSWPDCTAAALELILDRLTAEDANFLTVDQLGWRHALQGRVREATTRLTER
ncbi:MAG: hypothetical protein JO244_10105, partial [Solirubrobacterales bacterium]|nr:hypothetical protein [Solirubrobacterales bacterium]